MLTAVEVPRLENGGIALCHYCQRAVYFAGGFMELLLRKLERTARNTYAKGCCPKCGGGRLYHIQRYTRMRCTSCGHEWSQFSQTALRAKKKPVEWYAKIISLRNSGLNPRQIARELGLNCAKSVYAYLKRKEVHDRLAQQTGGEE